MSRFYSYLQTAKKIISSYKGEKPFVFTLRDFFSSEKKYGSRDRKQVAHLCYSFFRTGLALKGWELEKAIVAADLLCATEASEFLLDQKPGWREACSLPREKRFEFLGIEESDLFPFNKNLSGDIDATAFRNSFLYQPNVFARIRPGQERLVLDKLNNASIAYQLIGKDCLAFNNSTKIDKLLTLDKEVVIQDRSSQSIGSLIQMCRQEGKSVKTWDCCAASGGKSILAVDILEKVELTVSDKRKSILNNLANRFKTAGIAHYKSFVADLSDPGQKIKANEFDLLMADMPCTGSGTWARTPEQLYFFKEKKIEEYASLQKKISSRAWAALKPGGHLLYITCSVFKAENEERVEALCSQQQARLLKIEYFKGYEDKADTLFAALLQKPL